MKNHMPFQRPLWFGSRLVVLAAMAASLLALALAAPVLASSPRSGALLITKECSQYTGLADSFCTITSSNLDAITPGSKVVYFQAAGATVLDSDIAVVVGPAVVGDDVVEHRGMGVGVELVEQLLHHGVSGSDSARNCRAVTMAAIRRTPD